MLDEEPGDAGVDALTAAPMCAYQPEPLGACEGFGSPEPACVVDVDGPTQVSQATYDAAGRYTGSTDHSGIYRSAFDDTGRVVREEIASDGCVSSSTVVGPLRHGWLTRERSRRGEVCSYEVKRGEEVVHQEVDADCDCRDVRTVKACEMGPHGPVRCAWYERGAIWTFAYDAEGHRVSQRRDRDRDGVHEVEWTWAFDAEGRVVEECSTCADCDEPGRRCWHLVYEEDPRRITHRREADGDGSVEIWRRTYDGEDRLVLEEFGTEDAVDLRIETVFDDRGGYRETAISDGQVFRTEQLIIEESRRTWSRTTVRDDGRSVEARVVGAHGGLIERFLSTHDSRGALIKARHDHYSRDARGLLIGLRAREVTGSGETRACTVGYRWSGPCPVPPVDFNGDGCSLVEE